MCWTRYAQRTIFIWCLWCLQKLNIGRKQPTSTHCNLQTFSNDTVHISYDVVYSSSYNNLQPKKQSRISSRCCVEHDINWRPPIWSEMQFLESGLVGHIVLEVHTEDFARNSCNLDHLCRSYGIIVSEFRIDLCTRSAGVRCKIVSCFMHLFPKGLSESSSERV